MRKGSVARAIPKRKSQSRKSDSYATYIYRVLKQVHPALGMSQRAVSVVDDVVRDVFERIALQASRLCALRGATLEARDLQAAVRLVFPPELAKHAVSEGLKACTSFMLNETSGRKRQL
jgi:histone H2B